MTRPLAAVLLGAALLTGCGDPFVVLGDRPGWMRLVAGVPETEGVTLDSLALRSLLHTPSGVVASADGSVLFSDAGNARILRVSPRGRLEVVVDHFACAGSACLQRPEGIALDLQGDLLVADPGANRLFRVALPGGGVHVVAGTGLQRSSPDGTPVGEAALAQPWGVAVAPDGTVYVSEALGRRVRRIGASGLLETAAGSGVYGNGGDGGEARAATLGEPAGLALAGGALFIADRAHHRVRRVELATGTITASAGAGRPGFGGDGGPAEAALLQEPLGLAAGPTALYIADAANHRVRRVDLATGRITTFAGTGASAWEGANRPAGQTPLERPRGVGLSAGGTLIISSAGDHVVWRTVVPE